MIRWYAVQTRLHAEPTALRNLRAQGFDVYLPRYRKRRRHARRTEIVPAPLFPGYMFVALDLDAQRWRAVHSTVGVRRLVCSGERPCPVPDGIVEDLQARETEGFIVLDDPRPGDRLTVLDGPFAGLAGRLVGLTDNERVTVLLNLMGRQINVTMSYDLVALSA